MNIEKVLVWGKWVILCVKMLPSYFNNGLTSNFDFSNVDMHEWKEQCVLTDFLKKILFLGKWAILGANIAYLHISESVLWGFFSNFAQLKEPRGTWLLRMLLANEILVFIKTQHFVIGLTSDFDSLNVNRHK